MTAPTLRPPGRTVWQVFWMPMLLALISLFGLLSALLGDGLFDALSWLALSVPIAVALWYWRPGLLRRRPGSDPHAPTT